MSSDSGAFQFCFCLALQVAFEDAEFSKTIGQVKDILWQNGMAEASSHGKKGENWEIEPGPGSLSFQIRISKTKPYVYFILKKQCIFIYCAQQEVVQMIERLLQDDHDRICRKVRSLSLKSQPLPADPARPAAHAGEALPMPPGSVLDRTHSNFPLSPGRCVAHFFIFLFSLGSKNLSTLTTKKNCFFDSTSNIYILYTEKWNSSSTRPM